MDGTNSTAIYWDSCIFISHFADEQPPKRQKSEIDGIAEQVARFDAKSLYIVTSVLTITEVLQGTLNIDQKKRFEMMLKKRNFQIHEVTEWHARFAQELRNYYKLLQDGFPTLTTPDAIHIATAYETCSVMYTLDENNVKVGERRPQRGLIPLSKNLAYGKYNALSIEKPFYVTQQPPLF